MSYLEMLKGAESAISVKSPPWTEGDDLIDRAFVWIADRGEEGDPRFRQSLPERRPYRVLLAGERAASLVQRSKAAREEAKAAYLYTVIISV